VQQVFQIIGLVPTEYQAERVTAAFQRSWISGLKVPERHLALLDQLRTTYKLGLVTNFRDSERMSCWLERAGISGYFSRCTVISHAVGVRKPHPAIIEIALQCLKVHDPATVWCVGDDPIEDVLGARMLGMNVVLVGNYEDNPQTRIIHSLTELGRILPEMRDP
jgi:putative hydrolase of the HAD superfamily